MQLVKNIISKKLELYNEFLLERKYQRAIWMFYSCFNIAVSFTSKEMSNQDIRERNIIWARFLSAEKIDEKKFKIMLNFINKDMEVISQCLNQMEEIGKGSYEMGDIYRRGIVGVLAYELGD